MASIGFLSNIADIANAANNTAAMAENARNNRVTLAEQKRQFDQQMRQQLQEFLESRRQFDEANKLNARGQRMQARNSAIGNAIAGADNRRNQQTQNSQMSQLAAMQAANRGFGAGFR